MAPLAVSAGCPHPGRDSLDDALGNIFLLSSWNLNGEEQSLAVNALGFPTARPIFDLSWTIGRDRMPYSPLPMAGSCVTAWLPPGSLPFASSETESEAGDVMDQPSEEMSSKLNSSNDPTGFLRMVSRNNLFNR